LRPAAEQNIRIGIITATQLKSAAAVQNGGTARVLSDVLHHSA